MGKVVSIVLIPVLLAMKTAAYLFILATFIASVTSRFVLRDMIERQPLKQDFSLSKSDELELQDLDCNQECKSSCTHDVEECEQECGCDKKKRTKEFEIRDPCDQNCLDNCEGDENECNHNCGCEMRKRTHELEIRDPCDQNCFDNCDGDDDECYRGCDCDEYVN